MQVINFTEARNSLKNVFDKVYYDKEDMIITRKNSQSVVVISLDEYNSMKETNYLLSSQNNKQKLLKSLEDSRNDKTFEKELLD